MLKSCTSSLVPLERCLNQPVTLEMRKLLVLFLLLIYSGSEHSEENFFSITLSQAFVKSNTKCTSHCVHGKDNIIFKSKISIGTGIVDKYVDTIKYETRTQEGIYKTLCYVNVLKCPGYKHSKCYCTKNVKENVFDVVLNLTAETFHSGTILRAGTVYRNTKISSNEVSFPVIYDLNTAQPLLYIENNLLNNTSIIAIVNKEHCALGVIMKDVDNGLPYRLQITDTSTSNSTMIEDQPLIMSLHVTGSQNFTLFYDPCNVTEFRKTRNFQVQAEVIQNLTVDNVTVYTSSTFIPTEVTIVSFIFNVLFILALLFRYSWKRLKILFKKEKEHTSVHEANSHCSIGVNTDINVEDNLINNSEDQRPVEETLTPEQISIVNEDDRHSLIGMNANTNDEDNIAVSGEEEKEALIPTKEFKNFTNPNDRLTCIRMERNSRTNGFSDSFRTTELFTNQSPHDYEMKVVTRETI